MVLEGILCQALLPRTDGRGRAMVMEILVPTPAIRNLIREDRFTRFISAMQTGTSQTGMQTFNQALASAYFAKATLWTWRFRALRIQTSAGHDQPRSNGPDGRRQSAAGKTIRVLRAERIKARERA